MEAEQPEDQKIKAMPKLGMWLGGGVHLVTSDLGKFIVISAVAVAVSVLTCGLLTGPMAAGLVIVLIKASKGKPISVGDLFKGLERFVPSFLLWLFGVAILVVFFLTGWGISQLVMHLGPLRVLAPLVTTGVCGVGIVVNVAILIVFGLAMFFVADQQAQPFEAIHGAMRLIGSDPAALSLFSILALALGGSGALVCGVGVVVTLGFYFAVMLRLYEDLVGIQSDPE
jgi:hypothetical protein